MANNYTVSVPLRGIAVVYLYTQDLGEVNNVSVPLRGIAVVYDPQMFVLHKYWFPSPCGV